MSWGGSEFSSETSFDSYFKQPGVVYFAAAGDSPGVMWPSTSPNVVSAGGTSVATPVWAGIVNAAGHFYLGSQEFTTLYADQGTTPITMGTCGPNQGYLAGGAWNFCTGLGSPLGEAGK
jgi:hypothetical protein